MRLPDSDDLRRTVESLSLRVEDALAFGTTSVLFAKGHDRVLRLTTDPASHNFLVSAQQETGLAVPLVYRDYGVVGRYEDDGDDSDFELLECERLAEMSEWPKAASWFNTWLNELFDGANLSFGILSGKDEIRRLQRALGIALTARCPEPLVSAHRFAAELALRIGYDMDLSDTNCMVRPATGEVLLIDPLHY